ncbi:MAG: Na+/H+ antiporter NhaA, partial [Actinomycetota bacterium]
FLLTLAIVDDIGAIVVIAIVYTTSISLAWLGMAAGLLVLILILRKFRVWYLPVYVILGSGVWFATHESGVHATIAGVVLGLLAPASALLKERAFEHVEDILTGEVADPVAVRNATWKIRESVPITARLTGLISPWTSFLVIPLFALANAGIVLNGDALGGALGSRVTLGVVLGLVVGKPLGVYVFSRVALRAGWARLPEGMTNRHLLGAGAVAGIGFTVALFIADLAFVSAEVQETAVIGVLAASILATILGWFILRSVPVPTSEVPFDPSPRVDPEPLGGGAERDSVTV